MTLLFRRPPWTRAAGALGAGTGGFLVGRSLVGRVKAEVPPPPKTLEEKIRDQLPPIPDGYWGDTKFEEAARALREEDPWQALLLYQPRYTPNQKVWSFLDSLAGARLEDGNRVILAGQVLQEEQKARLVGADGKINWWEVAILRDECHSWKKNGGRQGANGSQCLPIRDNDIATVEVPTSGGCRSSTSLSQPFSCVPVFTDEADLKEFYREGVRMGYLNWAHRGADTLEVVEHWIACCRDMSDAYRLPLVKRPLQLRDAFARRGVQSLMEFTRQAGSDALASVTLNGETFWAGPILDPAERCDEHCNIQWDYVDGQRILAPCKVDVHGKTMPLGIDDAKRLIQSFQLLEEDERMLSAALDNANTISKVHLTFFSDWEGIAVTITHPDGEVQCHLPGATVESTDVTYLEE